MTLCVASQRVLIVVSAYFVIDSVRKLLDTPSYIALVALTLLDSRTFRGLYVHGEGTDLRGKKDEKIQ
jgi:hypothetical protein